MLAIHLASHHMQPQLSGKPPHLVFQSWSFILEAKVFVTFALTLKQLCGVKMLPSLFSFSSSFCLPTHLCFVRNTLFCHCFAKCFCPSGTINTFSPCCQVQLFASTTSDLPLFCQQFVLLFCHPPFCFFLFSLFFFWKSWHGSLNCFQVHKGQSLCCNQLWTASFSSLSIFLRGSSSSTEQIAMNQHTKMLFFPKGDSHPFVNRFGDARVQGNAWLLLSVWMPVERIDSNGAMQNWRSIAVNMAFSPLNHVVNKQLRNCLFTTWFSGKKAMLTKGVSFGFNWHPTSRLSRITSLRSRKTRTDKEPSAA